MTAFEPNTQTTLCRWGGASAAAAAVALTMAACGGGNPLGNPPDVANPPGSSGQSLSFVYFQRCINPVLIAQMSLPGGGSSVSRQACSSAGTSSKQKRPSGPTGTTKARASCR